MMRRRALLLAAAPAFAAGCGFQLRSAPAFRFRTIALVGFAAGSNVESALKRSIAGSGTTRVVEAVTQAEVVLQALTDARERVASASTAYGQVREITLTARLEFELHTPSGKLLIPRTETKLSRDMSYNESDALAKEQEDALIFRAMQEDIASQVVRRLEAVQPAA